MFYRFGGKDKLLSFGAYPAVSLKLARERRDEARALLARDIDPAEHKKELKKAEVALTEHTFKAIAIEWYMKFRSHWTPKHSAS